VISAVNNQNCTFSSASSFLALAGKLTSPRRAVGYRPRKLNFTSSATRPSQLTTGTIKLLNLADARPQQRRRLILAWHEPALARSGGFHVSWNTANVLAANPVANVPLRNSCRARRMALLGLAGIVGLGGRKRRSM
jgi:hypothetical protein